MQKESDDPVIVNNVMIAFQYSQKWQEQFKLEVGESLIEYITRKRIERSIVLLNTTDLKAYEK